MSRFDCYVWTIETFVGGGWVPMQSDTGNPRTYYIKRHAEAFVRGCRAHYKEPALRIRKYEAKP